MVHPCQPHVLVTGVSDRSVRLAQIIAGFRTSASSGYRSCFAMLLAVCRGHGIGHAHGFVAFRLSSHVASEVRYRTGQARR